jgi:integrase
LVTKKFLKRDQTCPLDAHNANLKVGDIMRKPFYFTQKKCWYVKDDHGKAIRLDPSEQEAYRIWQNMRNAATTLNHPRSSIGPLVEAWLVEHKPQLTSDRYYAVGNYLGRFVDGLGPATPARSVTASSVINWAATQLKVSSKGNAKPWSQWAKHDAMACVKRVFKWAHSEGFIPRNPIASLKLRKPRGRSRTITDAEHQQLIAGARSQKANGPQFAIYLIASHCGARPQQIRDVTAAHVHQSGTCWVFQEHKTDEDGKPLVVYINPCLQTLTKILSATHPKGPLFRQENGEPWKKDTVTLRLRRLRRKLKMDESVVAYCYRHSFATDALLAGVPVATVAALLGHKDIRMVSQVYGHLDQHSSHLLDAANQAQRRRLGQ